MKLITVVLALALVIMDNNGAWPAVSEVESDAYSTVDTILLDKQHRYGIDEVLLVLDLDNTLLTMDTDLGSDIWYRWQTAGVDGLTAPQADRPRCLFDTIGTLFELNTMRAVERDIPASVASWRDKGMSILVLSSRGPKYRSATERELKRNGLEFSHSALRRIGESTSEFSYMALNKGKSKSDSAYSKADLREISYKNGILLSSGIHKGTMLDQILEKVNRQFDAIVVVDDGKDNLDAMKDTFSHRDDVDLSLIHYTKVERERRQISGKVLTEEQAKKMSQDWRSLEKALDDLFPNRKQMPCS